MQPSKARRAARRIRVASMLITARLVGVPEHHLAPYRARPVVSNLGALQTLINHHR